MSNNIDMCKLGDGDNEEWKKAYPILLSRAKYQLLWTLGILKTIGKILLLKPCTSISISI